MIIQTLDASERVWLYVKATKACLQLAGTIASKSWSSVKFSMEIGRFAVELLEGMVEVGIRAIMTVATDGLENYSALKIVILKRC